MGKKKSLGHNPLAYSMMGHASLDFIPSQQQEKDENNEIEGTDEGVSKITASYYLEEPLVSKIKSLANKENISYSSLVNMLLKISLKEYTE